MDMNAVERFNGALPARLGAIVAAKLGTTATFLRWERDHKTGADVPVFSVPVEHHAQARALGLTVEN
jgi:hypothetical protein